MISGRITDKTAVLPISELYVCVQSEGSRAGYPTIAIRTSGCTHRCFFGNGGFCDSWQVSWYPEDGKYTFMDIIKMYDDRPDIKEMMLTGGSATMHPALVNELTHFCNERSIIMTLEHEGSRFVETDFPIDLISLSPKFSNTVPVVGVISPNGTPVTQAQVDQHNHARCNKVEIRKTLDYHANYHLKVVCNPLEQPEIWAEILEFITDMHIPNDKVWIMPPGDNREELIRVYPMVMDFCASSGYKFTGRDHIIAYDTQRYV